MEYLFNLCASTAIVWLIVLWWAVRTDRRKR